jgi:uncharacterized protein (TIRG00374 family)
VKDLPIRRAEWVASNAVLPVLVGSRWVSIERLAVMAVIPVGGVLAAATLLVGGQSLAENLGRIGVAAVPLFLLAALWQNGFRFLRWWLFARGIGIRMGVYDGALLYAAGCSMALTPGRIGEMLRLWLIEKRFGTPYRRSAGLYVADRVADADAYLLLVGIAVALGRPAPGLAWSVLGVVLVVNLCLLFPRLTLDGLGLVYKMIRRCRRPLVWLRRVVRNSAALFRPTRFLPGLALGVVAWSAVPVVLVFALGCMGIELGLPRAMIVCAAASLIGGSTMLPGGGGGTEAAMILLLRAADVPLDAAVAATIATRITFLWLPVGGGLLTLPIAMRAVRRWERAPAAPLADAYRGAV